MWCIPKLDEEYIERMMDVLAVLERSYDPKRPVVCFDEKSTQLLSNTRKPQSLGRNKLKKVDYEYQRRGTVNLFVCTEPRGGRRNVKVTKHRRKPDFARAVRDLVLIKYKSAKKVVIILDNLNTHTPKCVKDELPKEEADAILNKVEWHYTPKHASWLNPAEIEIGVLTKQCLKQRIATFQVMQSQVAAWQRHRNQNQATINWQFTRQKAQDKFKLCCRKGLMG